MSLNDLRRGGAAAVDCWFGMGAAGGVGSLGLSSVLFRFCRRRCAIAAGAVTAIAAALNRPRRFRFPGVLAAVGSGSGGFTSD